MSFAAITSLRAVPPDSISKTNRYTWINLVSDINGVAQRSDANLVNPWAMAVYAGAIWVADNGSGVATVYDTHGRLQPNSTTPLVVTIPIGASSSGIGVPTGQVYNNSMDFTITESLHSAAATFLFSTEDGTISGWNNGVDATNAVLGADRSATGAVYKGLAIAANGMDHFLYATNFHAGTVDVFDKTFALTTTSGGFADSNLPSGFAPFGIQFINNQFFVTYAKQNGQAHDDVPGAGNGYIDIFDVNGNLVKRVASQGALNSPWGLAIAPHNFGKFRNALLVGNFGDGRISAYDLATGNYLGQLEDKDANPLAFNGLWGLATINNSVYFTAGIADEGHGLFGVISHAGK
ncbi:MAG: TIGR03118 family protein [Chthoniobacteraceae bacterium]